MIKKGNYGYIKNRKIITTLRTVLLFALSIGIYFAGLLILKTNKSVVTVIAILGILPASKSAVNMIMFLRFPSILPDKYNEYKEAVGNLNALFENVFTTREKSFYAPAIVYADKNLCMYMKGDIKDAATLEKHIDESLKVDNHKGILVKVFNDEKQFIDRAVIMQEHFGDSTENGSADAVFATLGAISL